MRTTDGRWPACSARRIAVTPDGTSWKATAAKRRVAGSGTSCSVARVMTPSVPSEPTNSCVSSGPIACRGTGSVSIEAAGGRGHAQRQQQVLDLAVARGEHAGAARGDVAADRRPLDRGGVVREHQPARVELGLELTAVLAGLHGDGQRRLVDLEHAVERAQVDDDAALRGERPALRARAAAPRDDRDAPARPPPPAPSRRPPRCVAARPRPGARSALRRLSRPVRASTCRPCTRPGRRPPL